MECRVKYQLNRTSLITIDTGRRSYLWLYFSSISLNDTCEVGYFLSNLGITGLNLEVEIRIDCNLSSVRRNQ